MILSQAMDSLQQSHPAEFFIIPSADDIELSQFCTTLEKSQNDSDLEKCIVSESLGIEKKELDDVIENAVDCAQMIQDGGCEVISSWKYPKVKSKFYLGHIGVVLIFVRMLF